MPRPWSGFSKRGALPPSFTRRRSLRRFVRAERGTAAVEFAALAVPFLGIICVTIETAVDYWAQCTLDAALSDAARTIYTGQFQTANAGSKKSASDLLTALRQNMCTVDGKPRPTMFVCSNVRLSVTSGTAFANASTSPTTVDSNTKQTSWNPNFSQYACGVANSIVRVQAAVDFPVFFNLINYNFDKLPGNRRVLQAAAVFRVEPFANAGACT